MKTNYFQPAKHMPTNTRRCSQPEQAYDLFGLVAMEARQRTKLTSVVAAEADTISLESHSFVGLVSIRDQKSNYPPDQESKTSQEFEFAGTGPNSSSAANPMITPADLLVSNGQLQTQELAFRSNQSFVTNPPSFRCSLQATHCSSQKSSGQIDNTSKYNELHNASKKNQRRKALGQIPEGNSLFFNL